MSQMLDDWVAEDDRDMYLQFLEDQAWDEWQSRQEIPAVPEHDEYVHDPDDHERPGCDTYTDNLRGGYPAQRWDVV